MIMDDDTSMMKLEHHKATVRRWIELGWNKRDLSIIDEIFAEDVVQHDPNAPVPVHDRAGLLKFTTVYLEAFPDLHFTTEDLIGEGDEVLWRFRSQGTHTGPLGTIPATGKKGTVTGMVLFRFSDNIVSEIWANVDILGLMQQLGVVPSTP